MLSMLCELGHHHHFIPCKIQSILHVTHKTAVSSNLVQESLLGVFPNSYVTQHLSLLNNRYDTGQVDIQQ